MASEEEIATYFEELNIVASEDVLHKCLEICLEYNVSAEDFCDQWYAYTASNLNGAAPTVEHLEKLKRKEFQQSSNKVKSHPHINYSDDNASSNTYNNATTPKKNAAQPNSTPLKELSHKPPSAINNDLVDYQGSNYRFSSPSVPSQTFLKRNDSGKVQCHYGDPTDAFGILKDQPVNIYLNEGSLGTNAKYMYETLLKKCAALNGLTCLIGEAILDDYKLTASEGMLKQHTGKMVTYGRIVCSNDGKLNPQSVLLEGTREQHLGNCVPLVLNNIPKFSLFPGQVVAVQGDSNRTSFVVENIYTDSSLQLPVEVPVTGKPGDSLQIVIASGPFTVLDNLCYEPLQDLLKFVVENKPHVLILIGPFVDGPCLESPNLLQDFTTLFEDLIQNIMDVLKGVDVQVIIISSPKDAHHFPIYPTPPFIIRNKYEKLTFAPDPCLVNVNGLLIGATSADVLLHMTAVEMHHDKKQLGSEDNLGRIATHLLNQQNFYPLYPPHDTMFIDYQLFEQFGVFDQKPHVLILPSVLRCFVKNLQDCLVINPEHLAKGYVGGTFATLKVCAGTSRSICDRAECQVVKV